uniref:PH domain-containing protein n=1 Tax=Streptomyces sp. NBC_01393 TaxID=2903851 RepID=A0AAU3HXW1_9ACTN
MEPRNYRMIVSTAQDFVTASAEADRQLHHWLGAMKRYNTSALDEGRNEIAQGVTLDHDAAAGRHGSYSRWRLRETRDPAMGTWQSTLIVRSGSRNDNRRTWLQVDIEHQPAPGQRPIRANTPGIAKLILDALPTQDGLADVGTVPKFIEPDDVEEVIEELCEPRRRLPVVVASVPYGQDTESWTQKIVEPAFRHLSGLAVMYVLGPEAQQSFNTTLEYHPVFGGGIRTYLPGVDPAWRPDAQRHPVMSRTTIETNPHRAAGILASLPQRLALSHPLPEALDTLPVQRTRPRPATDNSSLNELRGELRTAEALLQDAEQREEARAEELRDFRRQLKTAENRDFEQIVENDELYGDLQGALSKIRFLQKRLEEAGVHGLAHTSPPEAADQPHTFTEILDRMGEFPHLRFTGNAKKTKDLDAQCIGNWVTVAWDALNALNDYAAASAAGTTNGDFRHWCDNLPDDCENRFPSAKVKMKESETVGNNTKWRRQRTFPVPKSVDPDEKLFMQAHLRVGGGNTVSPRLYFHDDGPGTGFVYIGYIGPHPDNTQT